MTSCARPTTRPYAGLSQGGPQRRSEQLAGQTPCPLQIPQSRVVPLWGGLSPDGVAVVAFHHVRKFNTDDWVRVVRRGQLTRAIKALKPVQQRGLHTCEQVVKRKGGMART